MSTVTRTAQRSSGGTGVICQIGMLTFTVDLATTGRPNRAKDTSFPYVCPDPEHGLSPERVEQRYICPDHPDHTSDQDTLPGYTAGECARGREHPDGGWVLATKDEITAAKVGDLHTGSISFRVHQAWEIDAATLPGKSSYRLRPAVDKKKQVHPLNMDVYAALTELVRTCPHLALVGSMRVRDARSTYRLGLWGNQLVLTEIVLPSDLADRDQVDVDVPDAAVAELRTLLEGRVEDFDETIHRFDAAQAVEDLVERNRAIAAGEITDEPDETPATVSDQGDVIDITSLLSQMVAASKAEAA